METNTSNKSLATTIAEHRLFKDLAPRYLALLAEVAMFKEFAADEVIFCEGDPANRFYLILDGEVANPPRRCAKRAHRHANDCSRPGRSDSSGS